ncbi:MAG TPA: YqgE/AlgH family protein [Spirochaetia bacterium]|nr:YqgE/AlgH family protein [Spirochaetia bacterium]
MGDAPIPSDDPRYLGGYLLISDINLMDPNFHRSVVLMITHDDNGAFGLVVNRPSRFVLGELAEGVEGSPAASIPIYIGGPLQQEFLFILHSEFAGTTGSEHIERPADGVVFEPATQSVVDYLKEEWSPLPESDRPAVRLYAGYAGWGPGQVEGELKSDAWVILKATPEIVFHPNPAQGWADAFAKKGPLHQIILQTGFKPSMN